MTVRARLTTAGPPEGLPVQLVLVTVPLDDELLDHLPSARWRISLTVDFAVPVASASSVSVRSRGVS